MKPDLPVYRYIYILYDYIDSPNSELIDGKTKIIDSANPCHCGHQVAKTHHDDEEGGRVAPIQPQTYSNVVHKNPAD